MFLPPSLSPVVLSAAKEDTQVVAEALRAGGLLQPDEAGQVPDRLSREYSENISCAGRIFKFNATHLRFLPDLDRWPM